MLRFALLVLSLLAYSESHRTANRVDRLKSKSALFTLIGLLFSSLAVAHAASPPADSIHFCQGADYERWQRTHPLPAGKRLAARNVVASAHPTAGNDGMTVLGKVTVLPAGDILRRPANFFDLEGKTVTFTPDGEGRYAVQTSSLTWVETSIAFYGGGEVSLPFAFPFAGRTWTRVHANRSGNVSFMAPETTHWAQRDTWSSGTMRSLAAAVDSRSAAGLEAMIAVLWILGTADISVASSPERVAITWDAVRYHDYEPAGPNKFQVRLYPSGTIEFAYRQVSERDGIVGLFHGADAHGQTLSAVEDAVGDAANAIVDIVSAKLVDNGSTVVASVTMAADIPARVSSGSVAYRVFLDLDGKNCIVELNVNKTARRGSSWCGASPNVVGYRVQGATIEIPISKTRLNEARTVSWRMVDAVWWGRDVWDHLDGSQRVSLEESDHDLSSWTGTVAGNLFEVFHYPVIPKNTEQVVSSIYGRVPADEELVAMFTDFRFDDLHNSGPGTGPINVPVQGIGDWQANPQSWSEYGSGILLSAVADAQFIGTPKYAESGSHDHREFHGHAPGVNYLVHELVHRWAAHLRFKDPVTGRIEPLTDDWCKCHWSEWLHMPSRYPVWRGRYNQPYSTSSVMGGSLWEDNGDGTFTKQYTGYLGDGGLSDLDLYVMGMIPPEEVRPTFLLRDAVETGTRGIYRATKVPVRIEDIVAAMGPRVPSASEQRKVFRLGVYLLHEDGRAPRTEWLARTQSITESVVKYFTLATSGTVATGGSERVAQTLAKYSGDGQQGAPGEPLVQPFVISVSDQNGAAFAGASVRFSVIAGGGTLSATTATTDANGRARTTLTLGSEPGTNTVEVSVAGLDPMTFTATAITPHSLTKVSGDGQQGPVSTQLAKPFVVLVLDEEDEAMAGVVVTFTVTGWRRNHVIQHCDYQLSRPSR